MHPFFDQQHERPARLRRDADSWRILREASPRRRSGRTGSRRSGAPADAWERRRMNRLDLQITFDAADPHAQARLWAAALGLEVDDHDAFVGEMLDAGHASPVDVVVVDGRRAWADAAACSDPHGRFPGLLFLLVPEPKTVKNRMHLDLHVDGEAPDRDGRRADEVARLERLGARRLYDGRLGPQRWVTMADPEGNEFCVG
jgi:hypothetical protein